MRFSSKSPARESTRPPSFRRMLQILWPQLAPDLEAATRVEVAEKPALSVRSRLTQLFGQPTIALLGDDRGAEDLPRRQANPRASRAVVDEARSEQQRWVRHNLPIEEPSSLRADQNRGFSIASVSASGSAFSPVALKRTRTRRTQVAPCPIKRPSSMVRTHRRALGNRHALRGQRRPAISRATRVPRLGPIA